MKRILLLSAMVFVFCSGRVEAENYAADIVVYGGTSASVTAAGVHVMTEHDCLGKTDLEDSIGLGSYAMDSHHTQRYVTSAGFVQNEGDAGGKIKQPYPICYRAILPKRKEATNLLVPVAVSASHIAFGSIRMEPVFMILGQSAATAGSIAIDQSIDVQSVYYQQDLRPALLAAGQILEVRRSHN